MFEAKDLKTVAVLGWADLEKGALEGGGYNLIAQQHSLHLLSRGHRVLYLQSGTRYSFSYILSKKGKKRIGSSGMWRGIEYHRLYNSSSRAPSAFNQGQWESLIDDPEQNALVIRWLKKHEVSIVYVHSLEGQSLSLIRDMKREDDIHVHVMCHDYFYICPQVKLLFKGRNICFDYVGGKRCRDCFQERDPYFEAKRALQFSRSGAIRLLYRGVKTFKLAFEKDAPVPAAAPPFQPPRNASLSNRRFLENLTAPDSNTFYSRRRRGAIESLSAADGVYVPSGFMAETLTRCGLDSERIVQVRIGLPHLDALKRTGADGKRADSRIVFGYRGTVLPHKGFAFFVEALGRLPADVRKRCRFIARGIDPTPEMEEVIASIPELTVFPSYSVEELKYFTGEYDIGVLAHLWFENSPVALLEHLSAGKPVLTPRLGGVEDYIRDGINGWFYEAGNTVDLVDTICRIVQDRSSLSSKVDRDVVGDSRSFLYAISEEIR